MANKKINELPQYTGNTSGISLVVNDPSETTTYKITKEKLNEGLISGSSQISYTGITNVPSELISGSSQVVYSGITGVPSGLVSGSSQISYTGITDKPSGIVSSSTQITNLGFATTGSQTINGSQTVNGDLIVTGSITANSYVISSSVYYVTESFSSGSSNSGNSLDDYHNFTGSVNITGSLNVTGPIGARLYQLSDVNDNITGSVDGYLLTYNSVANNWYANPGAGLKGNVRLFVSAGRSNSTAFFFNSITRTADTSPSPLADSAFMVTTGLLSKVTLFLRQDGNSSNSCRVDIFKNANTSAFSTATSVANLTQTLGLDTVTSYVFSGITLNQYDSLHFKITPGTGGSNQYYGIVVIE